MEELYLFIFLILFLVSGFISSLVETIIYSLIYKRFVNVNDGFLPFNFIGGFLFGCNFLFSLIKFNNNETINNLIASFINIALFIIVGILYSYLLKKVFYVRKSDNDLFKSTRTYLKLLSFSIMSILFNLLLYRVVCFDLVPGIFFFSYNVYVPVSIIVIFTIIFLIDFIIGFIFKFKNRKVFKEEKVIIYLMSFYRYLSNDKYFYKFFKKLNYQDIDNYKKSKYYTYPLRQYDFNYFIKHK